MRMKFSIYLILPAALGSWDYSTSKKMISRSKKKSFWEVKAAGAYG
jgi:hypothetical protein